ncbi:hypothetical protein ERICIV_00384 [Paenibacillus larvae subsp. larvae]|uniref:Integral membrane protein n=2 Tax=Paenibacillus larvae TaxID=1464 RepID=A0A2L1U8Y6_9BACL|nr:hypothetical protein [Paenibacillus larvae]AQT85311.1 hypothetical protein B1222_14330 [Paenibacillus larvae subsp. pulvifaciens]AVF24622.1 hypothetical protein ERICIII_00384 [Paenibacillus larvae subsp. larvae]AVF29383.1 hypothetical protein ERICIV_00384 [Paenibacillus larvae subsp. larvae]MBH0343172.1 hypothetical protein [Paenibacillus larvae]MCY7519674.1 hypothetical protein [Paenibacillus larvae]
MRKLSEIMVQSGILIYREITRLALFSLVCSAALIPIGFFFPIPIAFLLLSAVYFPLMAGVLYSCHHYLSKKHGGTRKIFRGAIRFYFPSVLFGLLIGLFVLILVSSWMYYGSRSGMGYFILAVFQTYFVTMVFVSQLYTLPLVIQQETGFFRAVNQSIKLFLKHPLYTIGAFFQVVCITVMLALTVVGFMALYPGVMGIYLNKVTANLIRTPEESGPKEDNWTLVRSNRENPGQAVQ